MHSFNTIMVKNFAAHFCFTSQTWDRSFPLLLVHRGSTVDLLLRISSGVVWQTRDLHLSNNMLVLLSPRLCFFIVLKRDLFVYFDDSLTS